MNTAIFVLRCLQLGLSIADLYDLSLGFVFSMLIEKGNDSFEYPYIATQDDINKL